MEKKYVFSHCFVYWTDLYIYKLVDCVVPISSIIICFWSVWSVSYRESCVKISCCEGRFLCPSSFINFGVFIICYCMCSSLELSYATCNEYFNSKLPFLSLVMFFAINISVCYFVKLSLGNIFSSLYFKHSVPLQFGCNSSKPHFTEF